MGERRWNYGNPVKVLFGCGRLGELPDQVHGHCLIVTSAGATRRGLTARIQQLLGANRVFVFDSVEANPGIDSIKRAEAGLAGHKFDVVVAVGGGSTIDFGKVLALALAHPQLDIHAALRQPGVLDSLLPIPLIAVPTTAGTGSEVTSFATVWDRLERRKYSLSNGSLYPITAILDPELTVSLSWEATLAPGLDAFSQCFESVWNRSATPLTTAVAIHGLTLISDSLIRLKSDPEDVDSRTDMLEASLCSGLAISRTRTALAHSISYPITAHLGLPHGLACSFTLPALLRFNGSADDGRLLKIVSLMGCANIDELAVWILQFFEQIGMVEMFQRYVPDYSALYSLVPEMLSPGRAENNLRPADLDSVRTLLEQTQDLLKL